MEGAEGDDPTSRKADKRTLKKGRFKSLTIASKQSYKKDILPSSSQSTDVTLTTDSDYIPSPLRRKPYFVAPGGGNAEDETIPSTPLDAGKYHFRYKNTFYNLFLLHK